MRTLKVKAFIMTMLFAFCLTPMHGQNVFKRVKKKVEDKAVNEVDEKLNGKKKRKKKNRKSKDDQTTSSGSDGVNLISPNFIDRSSSIFYDNFNGERATEFPSKWTQIKGAVQNNQVKIFDKNEGVMEWISNNATIKPTIKDDNYLGDSFKIELQVYFHGHGNEWYNLNFKNTEDPYKNFDFRISWFGLHPSNDNISRISGLSEGWHTIQLSFNKGNLKAMFNGKQLINDPDIGKYKFNYVELYVGAPGATRPQWQTAMVNYFAIGKAGLPLYERIVSNGRLVVRDIYFDLNKSEIKPNSYPALDKIVKMLQEHRDMEVTIEGHTDATGTEDDNQILSENRADAVKDYLISKGVKRNRLASKGYGEDKLISTANTKKAHAQNRRVEFVMVKQ